LRPFWVLAGGQKIRKGKEKWVKSRNARSGRKIKQGTKKGNVKGRTGEKTMILQQKIHWGGGLGNKEGDANAKKK